MRVLLNGEERELPDGAVVATAVATSGAATRPQGIAVAVDGQVVPHSEWDRAQLGEGQRVEVLQAAQGG